MKNLFRIAVFCAGTLLCSGVRAESLSLADIVTGIAGSESAFLNGITLPEELNAPLTLASAADKGAAEREHIAAGQSGADFFPLEKGAKLVYEYLTDEMEQPEIITVEFTDAKDGEQGRSATFTVKSEVKNPLTFTAVRGKDAVRSANFVRNSARTEFPLPLKEGLSWDNELGMDTVETLRGRIKVPAGSYNTCLKIVTRIGGGDAGHALRYYAPGVGLVYEEVDAEDFNEILRLVSFSK